STVQSIQASSPSRIGMPAGERCQSTEPNLSGLRDPNTAHASCCSSARIVTPNEPVCSIAFHEPEVFIGQNSTIGGSRDRELNDWQANPTGLSPAIVEMIVM